MRKKFKSQRTTLNENRIDIRDTKCTRNRVHLRIKGTLSQFWSKIFFFILMFTMFQ